jgi:hypothetical protein
MDLDLKAFSLTLAVGLAIGTVLYATLRLVRPAQADALLRGLRNERGDPSVLPVVIASVFLLASGIVCEDLSKNALDWRQPVAFGPEFREILPTEISQRCGLLLKDSRDPRNPDGFFCGPPIRVQLSPVGNNVWTVIGRLVDARVASPEELRLYEALKARLSPIVPQSAASPVFPAANYDEQFQAVLHDVYYLAKNVSYTNGEFFRELEALRQRYDFERSIVYAMLVGIYLLSFAYLAESAITMWRDVGGWKTWISLGLVLVLILAAVDVVASPERLNSLCEERDDCIHTRNWILPAALIFVCAYRTRRMWKHAITWVARSISSTVPGPALLSSSRELQAIRVLLTIAAFVAVLWPANLAYKSDQFNYLNRVFAYYRTLRGPAVHCYTTKTESGCEKASFGTAGEGTR